MRAYTLLKYNILNHHIQMIHNYKVVPSQMTISDGHADFIDCGAGEDEAFINISIDHYIAKNCEQLHGG